MKPRIYVYCYSNADRPLNNGLFVCYVNDAAVAHDVCDALARKHIGQWYGYGTVGRNREMSFSTPFRYTIQKEPDAKQ